MEEHRMRVRPPKYNDGKSGYQRLVGSIQHLTHENNMLRARLSSKEEQNTTLLMKQQADEMELWRDAYHALKTSSSEEIKMLQEQVASLTKQQQPGTSHKEKRLALLLRTQVEQQERLLQQLTALSQ